MQAMTQTAAEMFRTKPKGKNNVLEKTDINNMRYGHIDFGIMGIRPKH